MAQPDHFSDMLGPGEQILAAIGGPGPSVQRRIGEERVWHQLAVTQGRFLAVRLTQGPMGGAWQPQERLAAGKEFVRVARYPRTPRSAARLVIQGCGEPIELLDIDDHSIFPYVEPFLSAWGGRVEGPGVAVGPAQVDPYDVEPRADTRKLLLVVGAGLALMMFCCACSGLSLILKTYVIPNL